MTEKSHHHWLPKFFRRSSSTYDLKEKISYKPLLPKKSLGGLRLLSESSRTNVLTGQTLEETCRLGGSRVLILPRDFAIAKLTLPTCLKILMDFLLENGRLHFCPPFCPFG